MSTFVEEVSCEVICKRNINLDTRDNRTPWFTNEIKNKCNEKKKSYLQFRVERTAESYKQYKTIRNETNSLESNGLQKQIWRLIRIQRKEIIELIAPKHITKETCIEYLETLYKKEDDTIERNHTPTRVTSDGIDIETTDVKLALRQLRNRKSVELAVN